MKESFYEDDGDQFPINSQVRCGQSEFRLGFAHMTLDDASGPVLVKSAPARSERRRFLPAVVARKR